MESDISSEVQLRLKQSHIENLWHQKTKGHFGGREPILKNSIKYILDHLAQYLARDKRADIAERMWINFEGHSLEEVINEYQILKESVLEVLSSGISPISKSDREIIIEAFLIFMGMASWEMSQIDTKKLRDLISSEEQEKKWFETILNCLPVGVLIIERDSAQLLFANKAAHRMGLDGKYPNFIPNDPEQFATDADGRKIPTENMPRYRAARGEILKALEITWHHPGGEIPVLIHSDILQASHNHPERIMLVIQEIEERMRKERILNEEMQILKEEGTLRENFVSSLTHDLRTPLAVARMETELLRRKISPEHEKKLTKLLRQIDLADQMIRDLLDVSKLKAGGMIPVEMRKLNMVELLQETINDYRALSHQEIIFKHPVTLEGIWCPKSFRRIIENLLSNAIKYGDPAKPIQIELSQFRNTTMITVHNQGKAITHDQLPELFKLFKRLGRTARDTKGWGIGLSLVKGLTEAHHGKILVDSDDKNGTTFKIIFPNNGHEELSQNDLQDLMNHV